MLASQADTLQLRSAEDIVMARQAVRELSSDLGFSLVDQTKLITAASELARNTVVHGGGGAMQLETLKEDRRVGIRLTFVDQGPGIKDIDQALRDGYTTGGGLGLGLGGARRLSNEFEIHSSPGQGTTVRIVRWKP
jgi:serine/threonine-protein kinase RsbT